MTATPTPVFRRACARARALAAAVAVVAMLGLVAVLATPALAGGTAAGAARSAAPAAVLVAPPGIAQPDSLIAAVRACGADPQIVLAPDTVVARVPDAATATLSAAGFTVLRAGSAPPFVASSQTRLGLSLVAEVTRADIAGRSAVPPSAVVAGLPPLVGDVVHPQPDDAAANVVGPPVPPEPWRSLVARTLPRATEPAAFAAGSVAVAIIFPQSVGSAEASSEDWADPDPANPGDRRTNVVAKVLAALVWWHDRSPSSSLVFVVGAPGTPGAPQTVATPVEPIRHAALSDALWRHPIMESLGVFAEPDDRPPPETEYADTVRRAQHTDWAFVLYAVDSLHDADGAFTDHAVAYTFSLFGPYSTVTYDVGGYGFNGMSPVVAHEMGHVFGALDEYAPPAAGYPSTGDLFSGYLWAQNRNAVVGGTTDFTCIMRGPSDLIAAYDGGLFDCVATRAQVGWRDGDKDGTPDVTDTAPSLSDGAQTFDPAARTVTVGGVVHEDPCPHGHNAQGAAFSHDISVFVPHDVQARVDGGGWFPAAAVDGAFDQASESYDVTTPPLADGHHVLEIAATTGGETLLTRDIWAGDVPVTLGLAATTPALVVGGTVRLDLTATSGAFPVPFLPGIHVETGDGDVLRTATVDRLGLWSDVFQPRFTTTYLARSASAGQYLGPAESVPVVVGVKPIVTAQLASRVVKLHRPVRVSGHFRPTRGGARLLLQRTGDGGATWTTVASTRTGASSDFSLRFTAARRGTLRLRVRFAGDDRNLAAGVVLPPVAVR